MNELLLFLNQPTVLWLLFGSAVGLVLIDYLFPIDWPAYVGYALFAVFMGATVPFNATVSLLSMVAVLSLMLTLHKAIFSKYLTNLPRHERTREQRLAQDKPTAPSADPQSDSGNPSDNPVNESESNGR